MKKITILGLLLCCCSLVWGQTGYTVLPYDSKEDVVEPVWTAADEVVVDEPTDELGMLVAQITELKSAGRTVPEYLLERLADLEQAAWGRYEGGSALDQGGETCDAATVIPASDNVNYCVTGIMGATRDCVPPTGGSDPAYRDVFYAFTPTVSGQYIIAMCNSVGDVVYNIYADACCATTVFGNADDECGGSDPVGNWAFVAGTTYYIQCGYYGSSQVAAAYNFTLYGPVTTAAPENDVCATATALTLPAEVTGTIVGSADETQFSCGGTSSSYGGVYYTVVGTGDTLRATIPASTCYFFSPRIRVYRGGCNDWACVGGAGTGGVPPVSFAWCSVPGETYYIIVSSYNSSVQSRGPFTLTVIDNGVACTPPAWPENDYCFNAPEVAVPSQTAGTLTGAAQDQVPSCNSVSSSYAGVWYKVIGNDHFLTATTCNEGTAFDTRLSVYTGSCGNFVCVGGNNNDAACTTGPGTPANKSTVVWCSDLGVEYYILVHSNSSTTYGAFQLDILDGENCHIDCNTYYPCGAPAEVEPNNTCDNALNFVSLACNPDGGPANYYGTICPQADVDYYYIPAVAFPQVATIRLYEGDDCSTLGTAVKFKAATTAEGACGPVTGSALNTLVLGGCTPFTGGYIQVYRVSGFEQRYRLEVTCENSPACPNEQVANQHASGPCVGPIDVDYATYNFPIDVPIEYHITDLNVRVNMTHTYDGDIDMFLHTPWGDTIELSTDNGGTNENFINTVFDDEGDSTIIAGHAPYTGHYIPEEALSGVDGFNAFGTWTLRIYDDAGGDHGYLYCWALEFEYDNILAVELAGDFTATAGDSKVTLAWATASETDNNRFDIERDGRVVGSVDGAGTSPNRHDYTWTEENLMNGRAYTYTLVAVALNGERTTLATASATPGAGSAVITEYALYQNYPNPFNPTTQIGFDLVEAGFVNLKVYNLMGQEVATVVNGTVGAGHHIASFDATNLPSGIYLYRIEANGFAAEKKMLLMK